MTPTRYVDFPDEWGGNVINAATANCPYPNVDITSVLLDTGAILVALVHADGHRFARLNPGDSNIETVIGPDPAPDKLHAINSAWQGVIAALEDTQRQYPNGDK